MNHSIRSYQTPKNVEKLQGHPITPCCVARALWWIIIIIVFIVIMIYLCYTYRVSKYLKYSHFAVCPEFKESELSSFSKSFLNMHNVLFSGDFFRNFRMSFFVRISATPELLQYPVFLELLGVPDFCPISRFCRISRYLRIFLMFWFSRISGCPRHVPVSRFSRMYGSPYESTLLDCALYVYMCLELSG